MNIFLTIFLVDIDNEVDGIDSEADDGLDDSYADHIGLSVTEDRKMGLELLEAMISLKTSIEDEFTPENVLHNKISDTDYNGHSARKRKRRGIFQTGDALLKGILATRNLLMGARKMFKSKAYTQYEKRGGIREAFKDFRSVRPTNVKEHAGNHGVQKTGQVGDRKIILSLGNEDYPTLAIYIPKMLPNKGGDQLVDNIIYKD